MEFVYFTFVPDSFDGQIGWVTFALFFSSWWVEIQGVESSELLSSKLTKYTIQQLPKTKSNTYDMFG